MNKFAIFASARTGSTSLAVALSQSKDVKMAAEPFHKDFTKWNPEATNYRLLLEETKDFDNVLNKIFENYSAFKTLHHDLSEKNNLKLLGKKDIKILFLYRRSLFEQILSDLVAHQIGKWNNTSKVDYQDLKPIDPKEMKKKIDYVRKTNKKYFDFLKRNRKRGFLELVYEDLYSETQKDNIEAITDISTFLGIQPPDNRTIQKYMTPSKAKINYKNIYKTVPNYKQLKKRFDR
ncbi:hypothetical protein ACFL0F_00195 [Patescibacteria group bacterium]